MEIQLLLLACALIGLAAGFVGGIAGIGGSVIMLPALVLIFGAETNHHVYQAAAMIVNAVVAYSASKQHERSGAIRRPLFLRLWPAMAVAMIATVWFSRSAPGFWPRIGLAGFIAVYCVYNLIAAVRRIPDAPDEQETRSLPLLAAIGVLCGSAAGFLAIGGGILMVPLLQIFGRVQLKRAIATSAAVMAVTTPIGAAVKLGTTISEGLDWERALLYAAGMGLGAIGGARLGVVTNQKLSLPRLRIAISLILVVAAARMAYVELSFRAAARAVGTSGPGEAPPEPPD